MKAISYYEYGGIEKLVLETVEKPKVADDELLIRIHAASVNDFDLGMLQGVPYVLRLQNGLKKPQKTHILGSDIAGQVEAVGRSVTQFQVGDKVLGDLSDKWGGFAEYVAVKEDAVVPMSEGIRYAEAAALPQAGVLAYQGLFEYGKIKPGERVLINGAGGGVGTLGVQMAREAGGIVDGVDASSKFDLMKSVGFEKMVDYTTSDFTEQPMKYDIILDNKLNRSVLKGLKVLNPGGRYLIIGGGSWRLIKTLMLSLLIHIFTNKKVQLVMLKKNRGLDYLQDLYASGKLQIVMKEYESLEKGIEAIEAYAKNAFTGKVVINI